VLKRQPYCKDKTSFLRHNGIFSRNAIHLHKSRPKRTGRWGLVLAYVIEGGVDKVGLVEDVFPLAVVQDRMFSQTVRPERYLPFSIDPIQRQHLYCIRQMIALDRESDRTRDALWRHT
jgi:hypothetical protein